MEKTELAGMTCEEITQWVQKHGLPAFRGKQVFEWIHRGADFDEMTNISKRLRDKLSKGEEMGWSIKTVWGVGYKFEVK